MYYFLIPLFFGFASNLASAFTTAYSGKWGNRAGTVITFLLRNIFGIPVWAAGFVLSVHESTELLFHLSTPGQVIGWFFIAAGCVIIIIALVSIRAKAAAPAVGNNLVNTGIYSLVRHPIHSGTMLEFAGIFVLRPSAYVGIACITGFLWIYLQSLFEERDLLLRIPGYKDYMMHVPRFIPVLKKIL
jgi:protein-S-isoprenylcysteine O-methyltransferase Ste14